jgi:ABC-type transport system involved in cytochrome c biogenesis permease component
MRWLLVKDLQILRRSPLLVALLVLYPIVIAVLIGFALSRGPDKPKVAVFNQVSQTSSVIELSGEKIDISEYADRLFRAIEPVEVHSRDEAIRKVKDGDVLGALIVPPDITEKLQSGLEPATVEVFYNAEDPIKARYVQDTIKSQVQDANTALARKFTQIANNYLKLIVSGGDFSFLGRDFQVLGLEKSEQILREVQGGLPRRSAERQQLDEVIRFARIARDNLSFSDDVLTTVGSPIKVNRRVLDGGSTPLNSFAVAIAVSVSLMFVTLLLASGTLALEREENAFLRLVRGLVSRTALLVEKVGLAAICSVLLSLLMLAGLALFIELDWGRFPLWLAGLAAGALGFGAMGVAIGAVTREVRAASLLAFMVALPIAFLALVPSGSVAPALYDVVRVVSALFPFKATLDAMNAALNDSGEIGVHLLHLLALTVAFGFAGRLALRRFA